MTELLLIMAYMIAAGFIGYWIIVGPALIVYWVLDIIQDLNNK